MCIFCLLSDTLSLIISRAFVRAAIVVSYQILFSFAHAYPVIDLLFTRDTKVFFVVTIIG
jgi:hypothetical protein